MTKTMTTTMSNTARVLMICAGLCSSLALASEKAPHRDPHVHGHGKLKMAADKNVVTVQFEIPGMDLVGFEYEPKSAKEKKKVADALELFKNPYNAVSFPEAAGCVVDKAKAEFEKEDHDHHDEDHDHGKKGKKKDDHDHGKKHAKKKGDHDHKKGKKHDDDDHDHHEGEEHNEMHAEYTFKCKNVAAIKTVTVNLFSRFSGMKEVEAQAAMASGQYKAELEPKSNVFKLK